MSDDEEITYVKKQKTIHYGSLEDQERIRLSSLAFTENDGESKVVGGNINVSNEYFDLEDAISKDKQALLEEFERKKKARHVQVSTDDDEVKKNLRKLGQAICLYGEGPAERRNRLRELLSRVGEDVVAKKPEEEREKRQQIKDQDTTWYHEGPPSLLDARLYMAEYSLLRSNFRLEKLREEASIPESTLTARLQDLHKYTTSLSIYCSQIGDTRPISYCRFSPDSQFIATSSWSGLCKLWSVPDCSLVQTFRGHNCNVCSITFNPHAGTAENVCDLVSCASDGSVKLWSMDSKKEEPVADLEGHAPFRVSRADFHPSGRFLGTCCFDNSWRLWDLEQGEEVLHQEGHCKPVYCMSFQCDGSIVATGGLDAFGRVWDLRTGRCIMFMEGHLKSIYSIDFSPNGYQMATGSEDNTCRIWDVRKRSCLYTIPAHMSLVSGLRYQPEGHFIVTSSYDNTIKIWANKTWQMLKTLSGHDNKIMGVDISPDSKYIASSSYDRTFKLWAPEYSS
ncbi:U4/U6 small nuclear ribonucleoprotein Prp4 [Metopolophium dirhodum]|uniref:U4/U6 small nuclear ribonucleoprotein Prp4 n=1 Tax=Metopolophium dirhodum TaxID=44670 RepID=UPI00298FCDBD|nr:U4/U6 small nuclear ribonucleoprotein Prp4 [Metopolophium dirhodum]